MSSDPPQTVADILETAILESLALRTGSGLFVVGLCGPQGSGKSTVTQELEIRLRHRGIRAASLSLDDLYLGREDRMRLGEDIHPLLQTRGPPGTHDTALGRTVIESLEQGLPTRLPRFDKGVDERSPQAEWPLIDAGLEVLIFEGWCVGARPQPNQDLLEPLNALERREDIDAVWRGYVNEALAGDYQSLFARIDLQVLLAIPDFAWACVWRKEQERTTRDRLTRLGRPTTHLMDDEGLDRFMQLFERLTLHEMGEMRLRAHVVIDLNVRRGGRTAPPSQLP